MEEEIKELLKIRAKAVENFLFNYYENFTCVPRRLKEAMCYSLSAGGKRIRPVLCISCASMCGLKIEKSLPLAGAIEMIHTYSLIHDDLPAMDNDDLRRGRLSNHKAFDEATAILAGDGLLTDAFSLISSINLPPVNVLNALGRLSIAAGSSGMVGGQMLDMQYTGENNITFEHLKHMQRLKTGAMLEASCACGALLAGASDNVVQQISLYGIELGIAFQIVDDVLDITASTEELGKPAGSDVEEGKNTYPSMLGLEESRKLAKEHVEKAQIALKGFEGKDASFLRGLAEYIAQRAA